MAQNDKVSLVGFCPTCGTNLDFGGSDDCEVCAGEPTFVTIVVADERDIIVVIISDEAKRPDADTLYYLTRRFPDYRALPVVEGLRYVDWTDAGLVTILVPSIGG